MHPEFWRGKRVFITGHTGFKGSWLALWLGRLGAEVSGYALTPPTRPSLYEEAVRKNPPARSTTGDVRDAAALTAALAAADPEIIFHLAAQSLVRPAYRVPCETFAVNVMGTAHLLEGARGLPAVRAIVVVTSDKCYENREWLWAYRETEPMGGHDPYSASKGCAELVTASFRRSFFEPAGRTGVASARAGNVIGGGDWSEDRLIPDLVRAFESGRSPLIRHPAAVRPWQHVLDPLHGYLLLAERLWDRPQEFSGGWNFGPDENDARAVAHIADGLTARWPDAPGWHTDQTGQPHEAGYLKIDSSRARALLAWTPALPVDAALDWTADWYAARARQADPLALTLDQIADYETRITSPEDQPAC